MISSKSFMVLDLTLKSLIPFKFIFVYFLYFYTFQYILINL